ncbi:VanZ family protein [Anaerotardibacter muris]|uniref:VanZ family protein n=1 Tax=Anaerotardibacter muris TaxID=2941505 RepID=UPI00203E84DC|nr:VanZ family protein [Anaerotardibacter muris]
MKNFAYDIQLGFLAFPLVALILAIPYALYQYRRFGAISIWKTFVVFTFILYCLCAVSLIVFPLPTDRSAVVEIAQTPQLHPFNVIEQIREQTDFSLSDRNTWGPFLKSQVVYEAIFNVMLTIPLGAYLCYLFRCRWWMALLIGFATTLMFETSQLTGLFGVYDHPYRLFDVDDLILNTTGTMIGFWLMIPISWALPSMTEVNERSVEKGVSRATVTRRALALLVDLAVLAVCFAVAWILLSPTDAQIAKSLAIDPSRAGAKTLAFRFIGGLVADPMTAVLIGLVIAAVLFAVIPMFSRGRTIGKALVGLRIVKADGQDAPLASYWVRFGATALVCLLPLVVVVLAPEEIEGVSSNTLFQMVGLIAVVWAGTVIGRAIGSASGRPYVSLSEVVSDTRTVPAKQVAAGGADSRLNREATTNAQPQQTTAQAPQAARQSAHANARTQQAPKQAPMPQADHAQAERTANDDYGKQAALDSLMGVNYDEQHPSPSEHPADAPTSVIASAGTADTPHSSIDSSRAATQIIADSGAETRVLSGNNSPTQMIGDATLGEETELITNPEVHRQIRRDQRPDAGSTQVFKKQ